MKKMVAIFSVIILMFVFHQQACAQHIRFELGVNHAIGMPEFNSRESGIGAYGTLHLVLPFSPISVGTTVSYENYTFYKAVQGGSTSFDAQGLIIYPYAAYTFKGCKYFVPYIGLGAGVSLDNVENNLFDDGAKRHFALIPLLGIRLVNHLTLSLRYTVLPADYSRLSFNIGLIF